LRIALAEIKGGSNALGSVPNSKTATPITTSTKLKPAPSVEVVEQKWDEAIASVRGLLPQ